MMPAGPLMIEHRLIERMIKLMKNELQVMSQENKADVPFIDKAIDFIRTYADRTHHGKEEDILFRDLMKKKILAEHKRILDELIEDHVRSRAMTKSLFEAKEKYAQGNNDALKEIINFTQVLVELYPKHIEKEDKHFFLPVMNYFSKEQQAAMLNEFWEFDKKLIHEKYKALVEEIEKLNIHSSSP